MAEALLEVGAEVGAMTPAFAADWKPVRPINLIVPWAAGGSTDQITRAADTIRTRVNPTLSGECQRAAHIYSPASQRGGLA